MWNASQGLTGLPVALRLVLAVLRLSALSYSRTVSDRKISDTPAPALQAYQPSLNRNRRPYAEPPDTRRCTARGKSHQEFEACVRDQGQDAPQTRHRLSWATRCRP